MLRSITELLPLSTINIHKFNAIEKNQKEIDRFSDIANISQKDLPVLLIGCVNEKFYLLNNINVFYGVHKSKLENIECSIHDFSTISEFLIEHVKVNKNPQYFNSMKLFPIVSFLTNHDVKPDQIAGVLQIHDTIYEKIINKNLHPDAIEKLSNLFIFLSEKLTDPKIPFYVIKEVSKCDLNKQEVAVDLIHKLIGTKPITDSRFSFPSQEEIHIQVNDPHFFQTKHESAIAIPPGQTPSKNNIEESHNMLKQFKDAIIIPKTSTTPAYVINKKTNDVKTIHNENTLVKLEDVEHKPIFSIPPKFTSMLNLNEPQDVKLQGFKTNEKLIQFLETHPNISGVLIYKNEL